MNYCLYNARRIYHDIEVYPNFFCCAVRGDNEQTHVFMVNPFTGQNDLEDMARFYDYVEASDVEVMSANGLHYDTPVLNYTLKYRHLFKDCADACKQIKLMSNLIFQSETWWKAFDPELRKSRWLEADCFRYWSSELRKEKQISLKKLGIQLNFPVVQELPFDPEKPLREEDIPTLILYCAVYDVGILHRIFTSKFNWQGQISSFEEMLQLRKDAVRQYGFSKDCYSWDSVRLGLEVLLKDLPEEERAKLLDPSLDFTVEEILHPVIKFDDEQCSIWWDKKDKCYVASCFKAMLNHLKNRRIDEDIAYRVHHHNAVYDVKKGGLHTRNKAIVYGRKPGYTLHTIDVASYYPTLGALFKSALAKKIGEIKDQRLGLKSQGLGKTPEANLLKLAMNGSIGKTQQSKSPVENPRYFYSITINGQMMLLMLIQEISKIPGAEVVVANTDGIEVYVPDKYTEQFKAVCKEWERITTMELEYDTYEKIIMLNVNNYLAIPEKGGKPKTKGLFVIEPDLGNSCDFRIVPKLLHEYFIKGIEPEIAIDRLDFNIFDYCGSQKVNRNYEVYWGGQKVPQRLNRYYVSTEGKGLFKKKDGKKLGFGGLTGYGVVIFNDSNEPLKAIDKQFYIKKVRDVLRQISTRATTLFD